MCAHVDYINTLKTCTTLYHKIGHKSHAYEMLGGGGGGGFQLMLTTSPNSSFAVLITGCFPIQSLPYFPVSTANP